jgi:hypothetical protein
LEKQRRLLVIVIGDEIVVTNDAGFRAAYCRRPHHPQLIIRRRTDTDDHEVIAQAWQAAKGAPTEADALLFVPAREGRGVYLSRTGEGRVPGLTAMTLNRGAGLAAAS